MKGRSIWQLGFAPLLLLLLGACAPPRRALYADIVAWLRAHALSSECVAVPMEAVDLFEPWCPLGLAPDLTTFRLLAHLDEHRPDYVLVPRSVGWDGVRAQPWFRERYHQVYDAASPYDGATPLRLYAYTPSPFDVGERKTVESVFVDVPVELRGYRLSLPPSLPLIIPGEPLRLTLFWHEEVLGALPTLSVRLWLENVHDGRVWGQVSMRGEPGLDPLGKGDERITRHVLPIPEDIPTGRYALMVSLRRANDRPVMVTSGEANGSTVERLRLTTLQQVPSVGKDRPPVEYPVFFELGGSIELLGYDAPVRAAPGETVRLTLLWHVWEPVVRDYKTFVHLYDPGGNVVVQDDTKPLDWAYPTLQWQPGDYVRDTHLLLLPGDLPRGDYMIAVGMYEETSGERLSVTDVEGSVLPEGRIFLHELQVR